MTMEALRDAVAERHPEGWAIGLSVRGDAIIAVDAGSPSFAGLGWTTALQPLPRVQQTISRQSLPYGMRPHINSI
jgi:hypothetical protein